MPASQALMREKRQAILDSARDAFSAHGYEGASMAGIVKAAGVSKPTVYHHFPSKAALFGAFVERECAAMLSGFFQGSMPKGDTEETLRAIGMGMLTLLVSPVCLMIDRVVTSEAEAFPELAEAFYAAGPRLAIERLAGWLRRQTAEGHLAVKDADFAAEQFFTLVQTRIVLQHRLRIKAEPADKPEQIVGSAVAMFLSYYGPPGAGAK